MADADGDVLKPKRPAPRRKAAPLPDTPDPVEIAMKAVAAGAVPGSAAQAVLEKHACLIDIQCRREREELANVRVQRITRWLVLAAVAALIAGLSALVWNASRSESLVVEPFRVPPALGNAGLGGEVMATRAMDQIALMQSRTLSTRPADSYSTDWGEDINLSIPNTGATVGDLRRLLRSWFGREIRISGEVVRLGEGWSVTARVTGQNAVTAAGPELDPLVTQVAEGVFRQTQPYRHAIYLLGRGRRDEALAAAKALSLSGPAEERPWGLVAYANALGGPGIGERERLPALRRAAEAVPDFPMPLGNYAEALEQLGRWEEALPLLRRVAATVGDGSAISEEFRGPLLKEKESSADALTGAHADAAAAQEAASGAGTPTYAANYLRDAVVNRYFAHDAQAGDRNLERLQELLGYSRDSNQVAALGVANLDEAQRMQLLFSTGIPLLRAAGIGDREALQRELPSRTALMRSLIGSFEPAGARDLARSLWPFVATELARIGHVAEAEALLAPLEADCYPCLVARGEVAAAKSDRAAARRWFAEAVRQGPSFPFAHTALGRVLAGAGDRAGAEAAFARAERVEPRYADAWKHHADLFARAGDSREAARLYARAARHAPRWGALHIEWGRALWRAGEREAARAKFRAAAGMDLSAADRARLRRIWVAANGRAI